MSAFIKRWALGMAVLLAFFGVIVLALMFKPLFILLLAAIFVAGVSPIAYGIGGELLGGFDDEDSYL